MALCLVHLVGNVGREPEMKYTASGKPVTSFTVAVNQGTKDPKTGEWTDDTAWFRVSVWGDAAERMADVVHKGTKVFVAGRFRVREYEQAGVKRTSLEITATTVAPLEAKSAAVTAQTPVLGELDNLEF